MNDVAQGQAYPLGATVHPDGVNFSVFSKRCAALELLLFNGPEDARPAQVIELDPAHNHRTFYYWHAFVPGVEEGQIYGYRAYRPHDPERGLRYDSGKVLLDPYGRSIAVPQGYDREAASRSGDNSATAMKSVVADPSAYDWEGDTSPKRRFALNTREVERF